MVEIVEGEAEDTPDEEPEEETEKEDQNVDSEGKETTEQQKNDEDAAEIDSAEPSEPEIEQENVGDSEQEPGEENIESTEETESPPEDSPEFSKQQIETDFRIIPEEEKEEFLEDVQNISECLPAFEGDDEQISETASDPQEQRTRVISRTADPGETTERSKPEQRVSEQLVQDQIVGQTREGTGEEEDVPLGAFSEEAESSEEETTTEEDSITEETQEELYEALEEGTVSEPEEQTKPSEPKEDSAPSKAKDRSLSLPLPLKKVFGVFSSIWMYFWSIFTVIGEALYRNRRIIMSAFSAIIGLIFLGIFYRWQHPMSFWIGIALFLGGTTILILDDGKYYRGY